MSDELIQKICGYINDREDAMMQKVLDEACILFRETKDPVSFHDGLMAFIIKTLREVRGEQ
jgi:hypothetical protein